MSGDPAASAGPAATRAGHGIVVAGWIANVAFAITAVPAAITGTDAAVDAAIVVALALFAASIVAFVYGFALAVARSARGDDIAVANLYFLQGSASRAVQRSFLWLFLACLAIAAATAAWEPFGVLVPMLPVSLAGVWAARYGRFPPRPPATPRRRV